MSGTVWILITAISFISHVNNVQSKCMPHDIRAHLDDMLLKEHMFQIKVFSPETKEHTLLSVINTLCAYWTNNKELKIDVVKSFQIMLHNLHNKFEESRFCDKLNCTEGYTVRTIDTASFRGMYKKSCDGQVSDLKCPPKSTPLTTISPTPEFSTAFLTTVSLVTTDHERITSLTTVVSPNITASKNLTADPSSRTETFTGSKQVSSGFLVVSSLLNVILLSLVFYMCWKSRKTQETHEVI